MSHSVIGSSHVWAVNLILINTVLLLFLLGSAAYPVLPAPNFEIELRTRQDIYQSGSPVKVEFKITNLNRAGYYLLDWNTPFEGFYSQFFEVFKEEARLRYEGALKKHDLFSMENYVPLLGSSSIVVCLILNEAYDISNPGEYCVRLNSAFTDVRGMYDNMEGVDLGSGLEFTNIPLQTECLKFTVQQ